MEIGSFDPGNFHGPTIPADLADQSAKPRLWTIVLFLQPQPVLLLGGQRVTEHKFCHAHVLPWRSASLLAAAHGGVLSIPQTPKNTQSQFRQFTAISSAGGEKENEASADLSDV